jgi:hypothetical protein
MARYANRSMEARSAEISSEEELHLKARLENLMSEARQEFLGSGEPMLDWDGLEREIASRRR